MNNNLHLFRTGMTNATWAGSGNTDTFKCHYCGVAETVKNGTPTENVRWIASDGNKRILYACNECARKLAEKEHRANNKIRAVV